MFNTFDPTEKEKHHAITAIPIFLMKAKNHLKLHQPGFFTSIFTAVIMIKDSIFYHDKIPVCQVDLLQVYSGH